MQKLGGEKIGIVPVRSSGGPVAWVKGVMTPGMYRAGSLFTGRSLNSFLSLIFSLLAGRLLTVEEHGMYGKALAVIVVFQAITEVGMQFSLVRFLSRAIQSSDTIMVRSIIRGSLYLKLMAFGALSALLMIYYAIISLGDLGYFSLNWTDVFVFAGPNRLTLLLLVFIGGSGMSLISYLEGVLISHEYYYRLSGWVPAAGFLRIGILGLFYFISSEGMKSEHVVFAYALSPYLSILLFFLIFSPDFFLQRAEREPTAYWMRRLLSFNVWIMVASFLSIISDWTEVLMISNVNDTGLYNAARLPMQGFLIILATMQSLLLPGFSRLDGVNQFRAMFKRIYKYILPGTIALIPAAYFFVWFIPVWYGSDYTASVSVFLILFPNYLLRLLFAPLGVALFALDRPGMITMEAALRMGGGIIFNLILIPVAGIEGAAWASILAQSLGWSYLLINYYFYLKNGSFPVLFRSRSR